MGAEKAMYLLEMKPEEILDFQKKIKVDIGTVLDVFCEPETRFEDAKKELAETQSRMNSATGGMLGGMKLPGI